MVAFAGFFRRSEPARDKYLSRRFGLFGEEMVRAWCACPEAEYQDLGRPTLSEPGQTRGHTLDFTLRRRTPRTDYVAEPTCELEFESYRYLTLASGDQLRHHTSAAFATLLSVARDPTSLVVRRQGQPARVDGAILVWGAVTLGGRETVMRDYGFADVLPVEAMVADRQTWAPESWSNLVRRYRGWTVELFDFLAGPITPAAATTATEEGHG